jgi:hypothetical protein
MSQHPDTFQRHAPSRRLARSTRWLACLAAASLASPAYCQSAAPAVEEEPLDDETVVLSPFTVSASSDVGYLATSSTGGTRLRTDLRDIGSQISIMTPEFLEDIAATSLDDAFAYSLNIENLSEYTNAYVNNGDMPSGVGSETRSRTRGMTESSASHDFFFTKIRIDTYNTERITLASGPNSILFGLGSPSGLTDTTYKRAQLSKFSGELVLRVDDEGSFRKVVDLNAPVIRNMLAVRAVVLDEDLDYWRESAGSDNRRTFGTFTFNPFKSTSIRGWYEDVRLEEIPMRNTIVRDGVTKWLDAGRPLFNNFGISNATPASVVNAAIGNQGLTGIVARNTATQQILALGSTTGSLHLSNWANTVGTLGFAADLPTPDTNIIGTLRDPSVFPWDVNYNGDGTRNYTEGNIAGIALEQRFTDKIFAEVAYNTEEKENAFTDVVRGIPILQADANMYLPDGVTPNPNVGRLYFDSPQSRYSSRYNERRDFRATISGEFDLAKHNKWLGNHRIAVLYSREEFLDVDDPQASDFKIISNHSFTTGTPETQLRNANRNVRVRAYVDEPGTPGGVYWVKMPAGLDPMAADFTIGDVHVVSGEANPYGDTGATDIVDSLLNSTMGVIQSHWWDGRLVTIFGLRHDSLDQVYTATPLRTTGNSPYTPFEEVIANGLPDYNENTSGSTRTTAVVFHATNWISFHFNEANTFAPGYLGTNPDGTRIPSASGEGRDFGFTLTPFDPQRLTIRVNFYDANSGPNPYTLNGAIRNGVGRIEETVVAAGAEPHPTYRPQDYDSEYYSVTASTASKGVEVSLVANLTDNWRLALSVAKSESTQSDIGKQWDDLLHERSEVWAQYANELIIGSTSTTVTQEYLGLIDEFNTMNQSDGAKVESGRDWRINASTRYAFSEGALKGFHIGGQLRWRSEATPGYIAHLIPNEYPFPGVPDMVFVQDRSQPVTSPATTAIDAFIGYNRKFFDGKIRWSVQLNVRNLLDDDALTLQRPYSDGSPRVFAIQQPRSFILTNTFRF